MTPCPPISKFFIIFGELMLLMKRGKKEKEKRKRKSLPSAALMRIRCHSLSRACTEKPRRACLLSNQIKSNHLLAFYIRCKEHVCRRVTSHGARRKEMHGSLPLQPIRMTIQVEQNLSYKKKKNRLLKSINGNNSAPK